MVSKNLIPLYAHTLDTLCDELVSGRPIYIKNEEEFKLKTDNSRAVFSWYYKNRHKWSGLNRKEDVEEIVKYLKYKPLSIPIKEHNGIQSHPKNIHLKRMRAHRFAGIHKYGKENESPIDFEYDFSKPLTLIYGSNGSGKTSIANAIVWCLTGHIYRSQREPEKVDKEIDIRADDENQVEVVQTCAAITPIPDSDVVKSLHGKKLLLDTWVELTFVDDENNEVAVVKRTLCRTPRGRMDIMVTGIDKLQLDPVALEVGTRMSGMVPYIPIGQASDIGKAISSLTGIRQLEDLVRHAKKTQEKLNGQFRQEKEGALQAEQSIYDNTYNELEGHLKNMPNLNININNIQNVLEKKNNANFRDIEKEIEKIEAKELENCKNVLGANFDPTSSELRNDLINKIGQAIGLLDFKVLGNLNNVKIMQQIKQVSEGDIERAEGLVEEMLKEAAEIEALDTNPSYAIRERLYARIGVWIRQNEQPLDMCPICSTELMDLKDSITNKKISEHLEEHANENKEYLSKLLDEWARSWRDRLSNELSEYLSYEMKKGELPDKPQELIIRAFGEDLFEYEVFSKSLLPLKQKTLLLCKDAVKELGEYKEPEKVAVSVYLMDRCAELCRYIENLNKAASFCKWRKNNSEECRKVYEIIRGNEKAEGSLCYWLTSLDKMIANAQPIREMHLKIKRMRSILAKFRKLERELKYYKMAVDAIGNVIEVDKLVKLQVETLINKLSKEIFAWKERFYFPACKGVPEISNPDVGSDGSLIIDAKIGGTSASSKHISNSSDLRATLLAVIVSLWKLLLEERGGISLLIFDDMQELFDRSNQLRLASSLQNLIESKGRLLVTTNDISFGRKVTRHCKYGNADLREIHPIKTCRSHIVLGKFSEAIDEKRREFERHENENKDQPARDYVKELRIYLEEYLGDFYDNPCAGMSINPTLSELLNGLRRWRKSGQAPFASSKVFADLLDEPALQEQSVFMQLLNKSHHRDAYDIKYAEVDYNKGNCIKVKHLVEYAHEEYDRWLRRDRISSVANTTEMSIEKSTIRFSVPVYENLAAATSLDELGQVDTVAELFKSEEIGEHAIFVLNSDNFGFSAKKNSRLIVSLKENDIDNNSLVIAIHKDKIYARRYIKQYFDPNMATLVTENSDPTKRIPPLVLFKDELQMFQIKGVIFEEEPYWKNPKGEAAVVEDYELTHKFSVAFKIRGKSALPLALEGQTVLGAEKIRRDQIGDNKGELVAISFEGQEAFKRIGNCIKGQPRLRMFESIGGLGESILLRTEEIDDDPFDSVPLLDEYIYRVVGVLYL